MEFKFEEQTCKADTPVIVEVTVRAALDRDEFRRLCDRHRTREEIVRALRAATSRQARHGRS